MEMFNGIFKIYSKALEAVNPQLFTIATLTGHVIRAYGEDYSVCKIKYMLLLPHAPHEYHKTKE